MNRGQTAQGGPVVQETPVQDEPDQDGQGPPAGMVECPDHGSAGYCVADRRFGGIVNNSDMQITARPVPCAESHSWQAFSGLPLPPGAATITGTEILALPEVSTACSAAVMAARAVVDTSGWTVEVLPAADRSSVLCLAGEPGEPTTGSAFGAG